MTSFSNVFVRWLSLAGGATLLLAGCEGNVGPWNMPSPSVNEQAPGTQSGELDGGVDGGAVVGATTDSAAPSSSVSTSNDCGNGELESDEECDDGNDDPNDGCAGCVRVAVCGDGVKEGNEQCDSDADNCVGCVLLAPSTCGNGKVEEDEECDDGNEDSNDGCGDCQIGWCGDGIVSGDEACDDGNNVHTDGCNGNCQAVACGDGELEAGEECDPPSDTCSASCKVVPASCGNGRLEPTKGEQCDDGNADTGDGCFQCQRECGDGKVDRSIGETCEPGLAYLTCQSSNRAFCLSCTEGLVCDVRDACDLETCTHEPACGDGIVQPEHLEGCEPPGSRTCDHTCQVIPARCGNELVEGDEQCDPPDGIYCGSQCQHLQCGNGTVEGLEECDPPDGETCDDECRVIGACEPTDPPEVVEVVSNLIPGRGTFDETIDGWAAQTSVTASHVADVGNLNPGALKVQSSGAVSTGTSFDIRGVATCLRLTPNTSYTFSASYRFAEGTPPNAGATVSLHLYPSANCSGTVTSNRGSKIAVGSGWSVYTQALDTSRLGPTVEASVYVRLDVWRPLDVGAVEMLWDDLDLSPLGVVEPTPEPQDGYCGDCLVQSLEVCDDGNRQGGDGCNAECALEGCGNGVVDLGEQCDDGNRSYGDDCDGDCRVRDACRECLYDEGNIIGEASCREEAIGAAPGDGSGCFGLLGVAASGKGEGVNLSQLCSELFDCVRQTGCAGNTAASGNSLGGDLQGMENCYCGNAGENCLTAGEANGSCRVEVERALESNDPAEVIWRMSGGDERYPVFAAAKTVLSCAVPPPRPDGGFGGCTEACTSPPQCGNGLREDRLRSFLVDFSPGMFEGTRTGDLTCDELTAGVNCFPEESCGCFFEECDDNNSTDGDGCDSNCFVEVCGNGVLQSGEVCDDGNHTDGDGCDANCKSEWECGNGVVEGAENCDDGNTANLDGCDNRCELEICGNGVVQPQLGEQCDPDVSGVCEDCQLVQQDLCTECVLDVDIWGVLSDPLKGINSECVGIGVLDKSPHQDGEGAAVPPMGLPNGMRCLANPDCLAAWQCFVDTRCLVGAGSHECYCGKDTDVIECVGKEPSWATGVCRDVLLDAYVSQLGDVPATNQDFLERWQGWGGSNGNPLTSASALALQCISDPYLLDLALCDVGAPLARRVECQNHCFGDMALSNSDVAANQCP